MWIRCATCDEIVIIHAEPAVIIHKNDGTHEWRSRKGRSLPQGNNSVSPRLRQRVLSRDHNRCRYCGQPAGTVDHVVPISKGGAGTEDNLVAACLDCNRRKGSQSVEEFTNGRVRILEL